MKKIKFFKVFLTALVVTAGVFGQIIWNGTADIDWFNPSQSQFTITTAEEFAGLVEIIDIGWDFQGKTITLGADIMLNDTANWQNWTETKLPYTPTRIWKPIGTTTTPFQGTFDGADYVIRGVYISNSNDYQGLFGCVAGTIKNLGVTNSYVKGRDGVGGLVGASSNCTIENCYVIGNVTGRGFVGGLAGTATSFGSIENCSATGNVTATGTGYFDSNSNISYRFPAGGLVGGASSSVITNCYATGDVIGNDISGGLVGSISGGKITNCYATGNVQGNSAGGLVGYVELSGNIINCYATGNVNGTDVGDVGGLIGGLRSNNNTTITSSYYDRATSGQNDVNKGTSKTTTEMKRRITYVNWDFDDIWGIDADINDGYPYLRSFVDEPDIDEFVAVSDISGVPTSTVFNQTITLNATVSPQDATNKTIVYSMISGDFDINGNAEINGNYVTFTALGQVIIRATIVNGIGAGIPFMKDFVITVAKANSEVSITKPTKSDKHNGIIFEKNVVSDELKIQKITIPNDKDGKIQKTVIYDNTGNVVYEGGNVWNLRNKSGRYVANGSYLVIVEAKDKNGKSYWYSAKVGVKR